MSHDPRPTRRAQGERGTSLILALAFLSLLGTFTASILTVAYTSFKTTESARGSHDKHYGADGGADVAVELLRQNPSYCPSASASPSSLPDQTIDGRSVHITCQTLSGTTGGSGGGAAGEYALVVTGYTAPGGGTPDFTKLFELDGKDKPGDDSVRVSGGKVFNAGKFRFKNDSPILTIDQDLDQYEGTSSYCTDDQTAAASSGQPDVSGAWTCRTAATFPVPDPVPTLIVPTAAAPAKTVSGSCTILYPGRYTTAPSFDKDNRYYLASGVYYFDDVGEITMQGQVFGGQPGSGEAQAFTDMSPCADDAAANAARPGSATGFGVELVLGGESDLRIEDEQKAKVELFSRVPANPAAEGTPGVSIYAPRVSGSGYAAWDHDRALDIKGKSPQLVIHGLVYAPTSKFDEQFVLANTSAGTAPIFNGGLVVSWLKLKFKTDASNLTFATIPVIPATTRTVVVTATADPLDPGEASTVIKAVVQLGTGAGTPATVLSWRKV